ncbi:Dbl-domain containing protein [Fusarium austroafricanum]|uniref:Dbl-domain containing protein n=1 Tax=Fusarium austroafricanum TaxID=2364996 RepID=A0A8H4NMN2_9HYPO|nr:Dbl-domain containing protein [Fusarium austroafricanum]
MMRAPQHKLHPVLEHDTYDPKTISTVYLPTIFVSEDERSINNGSKTKVAIDTQLHDTCIPLISQRRNVIKELIDTEINFTRDMRILLHVYKGTADACPALDAEAVQLIFRNIDDIVSVHTSFQSELEKSVASVYYRNHEQPSIGNNHISATNLNRNSWMRGSEAEDRRTWIGRAFMLNIDSITMVVEKFLKKSDQVIEYLAVIQQNPVVFYWIEQCREVSKHLTHAWDLGSLLIKPVQRITRYPILISALLRYTPQDHPDWKDLLGARERLNALLFQVNTNTKGFEGAPRATIERCPDPKAKPSAKRMLRKSMSKMRLWTHRLSGNPNHTDNHRSCSAPLDDATDELSPRSAPETVLTNPFSPAMSDHKFPYRWHSSRSAPDLRPRTRK